MRWIVHSPMERKLCEKIVRTQGIWGYRRYRQMCLGWRNRLDEREFLGRGIADVWREIEQAADLLRRHAPKREGKR